MKLVSLMNESTLRMSNNRDFDALFNKRKQKLTLFEADVREQDDVKFEFFNYLTMSRFIESILAIREEGNVDPAIEIRGYAITVKNGVSSYDGSAGSQAIYEFQQFIERLSQAYRELVENEGNDY